jgi:hypothetical protein
MNAIRRWFGAAALLVVAAALGCADSGPKSYRVSGSVKLDGAPIPYGEVLFTPDADRQNSGPQGIAEIRDGKYDTRSAGGRGMPGGPTVIRVNGMSGPGGKTLCEYELKADLPRNDTSGYDIDVPKNAAAKSGKEI